MSEGIKLVRFQNLKIIFFLILFLIKPGYAQNDFSFNHPDCKVKAFLPDNANFLKNTLEEMAKKRKMVLSMMKTKKDIYKGEMYFQVNFARIKQKIYDKCLIDIKLYLAKEDRYTSKRDTLLYERKSTRSVPRITLKGNERCTRALKDAFIHIPTCRKK